MVEKLSLDEIHKKQEILENFLPLFKRAEVEGLWFYCNDQDLWFSPAELHKEHSNNRFIYGWTNWKLRDPQEKVELLRKDIENARHALMMFENRMLEQHTGKWIT